jgi:hypothetical protein
MKRYYGWYRPLANYFASGDGTINKLTTGNIKFVGRLSERICHGLNFFFFFFLGVMKGS